MQKRDGRSCGEVSVRAISIIQPRILVVLFRFFNLFTCGGATAVVLAFGAAVDESRTEIVDRVARSPTRLCSRDVNICYYRRLFTMFLPLALLPSMFPYFLPLRAYSGLSSCWFVRAAVICSCSARTRSSCNLKLYVFLRHLHYVSFQNPFGLFYWFLFSCLAYFGVWSYPVRWYSVYVPRIIINSR